MPLPYFFAPDLSSDPIVLGDETSRHMVQVLRMKEGEHLLLTDGKGNSAECEIVNAHKKHTSVRIVASEYTPRPTQQLTIGISLIKNSSRFEWFVEKAAELGVGEIIPIIAHRTEKQKFRPDRYDNICRSAMIQSKQSWMTVVHDVIDFKDLVNSSTHHQKFIAHCDEDEKVHLYSSYDPLLDTHIILIGPEGDFSPDEIHLAKTHGFLPVSLGATRLRTETAGVYAAVIGNAI